MPEVILLLNIRTFKIQSSGKLKSCNVFKNFMRYKGKKQYSTIQTEKQVQIMKNDITARNQAETCLKSKLLCLSN